MKLTNDESHKRSKEDFDDSYGMTSWYGPYNSGDTCEAKHTWLDVDIFQVKVKAKDHYDWQSEWSEPLPVSMPRNKPYINTPFMQFLEQYPILYQLFLRF